MTEAKDSSRALPPDDAKSLLATSALTIVRIKRRRDDPAEPEIILEAAGAHRSKQPRYDQVLLQFQGLSVMAAAAPSAPRQRFRRLQTMEVSVFEALSENEVLRLLRAQSGAGARTSNDSATRQPTADVAGAVVTDAAASSGCLALAPGLSDGQMQAALSLAGPGLDQGQMSELRHDVGQQQRKAPVKSAHVPNRESRIAALRMSQKQAATAARYKQIRRKREAVSGDGAGSGLLQMYELERLPLTKPHGSTSGRGVNRGQGRNLEVQVTLQGQAAQLVQQQQQQPLQDSSTSSASSKRGPLEQSPDMRTQPQPPEPQPQPRQEEPSGQAARNREGEEEEGLLQRYAPLVDEVIKSLSVQDPQAVRRIPARPKRAMTAAASTRAVAAPAPVSQPAAASPMETHVAVQAAAGDSAMAEATGSSALEVGRTASCPMDVAKAESIGRAECQMSDDGDGFVYDVYVPVFDNAEGGMEEDMWPWLDAPSAVDLAVPVIEVAENDDEIFWAGQLGVETAAAEEHDSEDSNAESYYANSYPDEESSYGNDGGSGGDDDELDELDPADADVGGGNSWSTALAMRRRQGAFSDEDDEDDEDDDAVEEEIFGRRSHSRRVRHAKMLSCYRAEEEDYSEHSSYLSEEEERREAQERRHRAMFLR
ncbi:hypothetical protein VaNZ11_007339 [Volvox africanus]|uniref:Transcription factor Iwr1 domain-containing protein n=1 Tax=Volvox africanus TaxID=51714 RepID=A0ABQ5S326_9CHLO|nr:hypothetical protein VaNZ11_007339 [Volvox africanus]